MCQREDKKENCTSKKFFYGQEEYTYKQEFVNGVKEEICKVLCVVCPSVWIRGLDYQ